VDGNLMEDPVSFLRQLIRAQTGGEAAIQNVVADAARALGCTVETVRYKPGDVPMVGEFAQRAAASSSSRIPMASPWPASTRGAAIPSGASSITVASMAGAWRTICPAWR
jgi:hypothetical protein